MHAPRHSQLRLKDEIARELLADAETQHQQRPVDVAVGREHRDTEPSFCNDERETGVDILTGGAAHDE
jgi:hypothetical protein